MFVAHWPRVAAVSPSFLVKGLLSAPLIIGPAAKFAA